MQDELNQFERNYVWELVPRPGNVDKHGIIVRNKARLVDKSYIQDKDIDYEKIFAQVARLESIRMFLVCLLCQLYTFSN
jgi:dUTPase